MNKKIYLIVILAIIVTTLSQTVSFISGEHQFYQSVQDKCIKCHGDIKDQLLTSTNHSSVSCNFCHVKSATNHTNANPACQDCHNTTQKMNDSLEAHTDFSSMGSKGCITCHTTYNTLVNYSRAEYIDYTITNKYGNWVISNITTSGTLNLSYNAQRTGGDHDIQNVSCRDCHEDIFEAVSLGGHAVVLAKNSTNITNGTQVPYHDNSNTTLEAWCRTCHSRNDANFSTQQHSVRKTTCEECHQAYNSTPHPGNFFANINTVPHLYRSLVCISCHSIGWPAPNGGIHFKVHQEPYFDVTYEIIAPLSIINSTPANDPTTTVGTAQAFSITLNRPADIYWYNNGSEIFRALSVISSSYSSSNVGIGVYNITAVADDGSAAVSRTWNWTVTNQTGNGTGGGGGGGSIPVGKIITGSATGPSGSNNISGYVFDNNVLALPGVLVQNSSYQNSTNISGYYSMTGLPNGTYTFSYSKAGFDTGYSIFTLNGASVENVNVIIYDTTPPASVSNINTAGGNFYINNSWTNPTDADFNYTWFRYGNGTTLQSVNKSTDYLNLTWSPHYTQNISAQTVDIYNNINPALVWFNATVPNNPPIQAPIGNKTVNEGQFLTFTVNATDADNDTITYGTNATKGTFNTTTGNFSWTPGYGDAGFYFWYFNSSDGYGGIANENVAVTVINVPLSITNSSPATDPTTIVGSSQTFSLTLNRTANVIWYNNGSEAFRVLNVTSATYINSTASVGTYNITASVNDSYDSVSRSWNWTVIPNVNGTNVSGGGDGGGGSGGSNNSVSGYVFDNFGLSLGGVLVQNGSYQNTTDASGYYSIANLSNGTYNFSYSRAGFTIAYFEFTLNGAVVMNANKTLYDNMSTASISNTAMTTGNFYVNNTWINPTDADFNYTWFRYSNGTTLQNVSRPVNYLNLTWSPHYIQNISAQTVDTSGNVNQTKVWFNTTIPNNAPFQYAIGNKIVNENENLQFNVTATDADSDPITYGTNATRGTFNITTGNFSWTPGYGDAGFYFWNFNSSDGYGGIANENVAVTVINVPLSIISSSPVSDPTTIVGTTQAFGITLNRTANVTWYINNSVVQSNLSVVSANYTNSTAGIGGYNVTAIANDSYDSALRTWNWTVSPQPTYNVSGYVFDNYGSGLGGVLVQNNSKQNTTLASGYYLVTGLLNGTYNLSYSKSGFNTGYLEVTINGTDNTSMNKTIYDTTPPASVSNSSAVTGNFYVNNTWISPTDADFNYTWFRYSNGTTIQNVSKPVNYLNLTWPPHYTQNISAQTVDTYGNINQTEVWLNATINNNPPVQALIGNKTVYEGQPLNFTVSATDADYDTITYGTNATKGTFNTTTGNYSWIPNYSDAGFYFWNFNSSDGYGGIANENVAVTVIDVPLSITSSSPAGDPTTTVSTAQTFGIALNRTANVTWYINGSIVQMNSSVVSANYTNSTAGIGVYNVTVTASDGFGSVSRIWNWTVIAQPTYNVSGYVFDNYGSGLGGVLVLNGSNQNTTLASGYYLITGLLNGTYNFSYSKPGFNTGYLGVTINGADNTSANITIYDSTPPASVSNTTSATGNFYINNTWMNPADADFNYTWFRYSNGTNMQNVSSPVNYLNLTWSPHYTQNISAQTVDTYGNINQTEVWFNATIPNNPPVQSSIGDRTITAGSLLQFNVTATDADSDPITYGTNATKGTLNSTTGAYIWQTSGSDAGTYIWYFSSTDSYGGVANETITVTVTVAPPSKYIPPAPANLTSTQGNFWINNSWQAGAGNATDSYNVSVNGSWMNGTTSTYYNDTVGPHGWSNITVWAYNNSDGGSLSSAPVSQSTQVANNAPLQTAIGTKVVNEGDLLAFTVLATDADNDTITYGTNATKGSFNTTTGSFSWMPGYGDAGVYIWYFNSSDGYGGVASETITVTVDNVPLSITSSSPAGDPATMAGTAQTFGIALNRTANVTWYIDGSAAQTNLTSASANYTNSTAGAGTYNVTVAATDGYDSVSKQWNWTVSSQPVYAPEIISWSNSKTKDGSFTLAVNSSETVNFNAIANQTITIWNWYLDGVNQNNNYNNFTASWNTAGTKTVQVNATNSNGTSNTVTWTVTVLAQPETYIPPPPANINSTTGNFWVNTTWQPGVGNTTDSYNVSVNGVWTNGTTNTYANSPLSAHAWQNVTVYAYNASGSGSLSASPATKNTQILNNPPVQYPIGNKTVNEGQWLNFTVNTTDADNDTITYGTNATKGSFNTTTGNFSWLTTYSDAGTYVWYFNSSDGYSGVASETITVTVNNTPLSVTSFSPPSDPTTTQGTAQTFNITLNRTANVTWYMNGTQVQTDTGITSASYTNSTAGTGTWNVTASVTDGIDTVSITWNWSVNAQPPSTYIPPNPTNLQNITGNFWVNHTWLAGTGNNTTDSYNVSVNGTWYNGTINTFKNSTTAPHGWVNITVWAYNSSGTGSLSAGSVSQNTQVPNNLPAQNLIGNKNVTVGDLLTFTVSATDADNDTITYGTNATKGILNATTGVYSWQTTSGDAGAYVWYFNSSDNYGGAASETITVTVNSVPLSITSSSPVADPSTTVGASQTFGITLNRTANVTWYINGSTVQTNSSVAFANYTNSTAGVGVHNVTATASDGFGSVSRIWNWTINSQPVYNVSGYVFDNYGSGLGGVLVQNGTSQNTTSASGYYLITGLFNGTYNFSYSKAGFNTGYLEVTINGADNTTANATIYDTTPPASASNIAATSAPLYINWTWIDPSEPDFDHVEAYIDGTFMRNITKGMQFYNASYFVPNSTHTISTRTVDTYGNVNTTWVNNTATTPSVYTYVFGFLSTTGTVTNFSNAQSDSDGGASATFSEVHVGGINQSNRTTGPGKTITSGTQNSTYNPSYLDSIDGLIDKTVPAISATAETGYLMSTPNTGVGGTTYWNLNGTAGVVANTTTRIIISGTNNLIYIFRPGIQNNKQSGTPGTAPAGYGWASSTPINRVTSAGTWSFQVKTNYLSTSNRTGTILAYVYKYNATSGTNTYLFNVSGTVNHLVNSTVTENITSAIQPSYTFNSTEYLKVEYWLNVSTALNNAVTTFEANTATPFVRYLRNSYSLDTTYTFTETNSSATWQSISVQDSSYGDTLANTSIFNSTSGQWESILTSAFNGSISPAQHVNVIKGANGNASSYDAGSGQIRLRYNWTGALFNNSLGVDQLNVTVGYLAAGPYHLNITTNTTDIPDASTHTLQLLYNASAENFTLQIWNGSAWNNRTTLNDTTLSYRNITLQPEELIPQGISSGYAGSVNNYYVLVRYLDLDASAAQQGRLYLDYQRVYSE